MSSIGPSLPPHLQKRKRDEDDGHTSPKSSCSSSPSSPENGDKRRRVLVPTGPSPSKNSSPYRVIGPTLPPAPISERPSNSPSNSDSSSDDDDFGPAPPPPGASTHRYNDEDEAIIGKSAFDTDPKYTDERPEKPQRDEWMMLPPSADDLSARMDPTKLRARKFNTGKSARAPVSANDMAIWTETPEQKRKRLENEILGKTTPANSSRAEPATRDKEAETTARRIREHTEKVRGKSLTEQFKEKGEGKEKEDDPSKRGFDYEKDMGLGMKIGNKAKQELLNKAKGFGDRFSGGKYL
ncbi:hypothetical protein GQ43DRAFT_437750 [Delitschia confertaspora ATCC 74209]|uniref:DUF3752 domain-containing protein n=1 Tax=Delitschia confertaspora ATCC 74209 TaxID=1513339 RepID=A0A9P4JUH3_9PLEO|nr:hypothetical protein GQ43DRAFT_437750 [Delitschia confertaspora ATCC 74209]